MLLNDLNGIVEEGWVEKGRDILPPEAKESCRNLKELAALSKIAYRVYEASKQRIRVRLWQLKAILGIIRGEDTIAGTGAGKTLLFILLHFLLPTQNSITLVVSPLKELMKKQVRLAWNTL